MRSKIATVALALALVGAFVAPASAAQAAEATVSGTVLYRGEPVADIPVGWFVPSTGSYKVVDSAADGSYELTLPAAGQKFVVFGNLDMKNAKQTRGDKNYVGVFYGDGDSRDYAFQTLKKYTANAASKDLAIELAKPGSIYGIDKLLARENVQLENLGGTPMDKYTEADSDGQFELTNLVPGKYRLRQPGGYGNVSVTHAIITVREGELTTVTPRVASGGVIKGVVTDSKGKPIAGVYVEASAKGEHPAPDYTDSKGRYTIAHLRGTSYVVTAGRIGLIQGSKGYIPRSTKVSGVKNAATVTRNVSLKTGGRVLLTLTKSGSKAVEEYRLIGPDNELVYPDYDSATATSARYGSLPSGKYRIYAFNNTKSRYSAKTITVRAGKTTDVGRLAATAKATSLKGTVTATGPVGDETVVRARSSSGLEFYSYIGSTGKYRLPAVVPGKYSVAVFAPDRAASTRTVNITSARSKNLAAGAHYGKVTAVLTSDGRAVPSGHLTFGDTADGDVRQTSAEITNGRYSAFGRSGSYKAIVWFEDDALFQGNSPYWAELPASALPFTLKTEKTTNLGTLALRVKQG